MEILRKAEGLRLAAIGSLMVAFVFLFRTTGHTASRVDLVLVLAMDVSSSVDTDEFALQRDGLARAVMDPQVLSAIKSGTNGRIAVSVVQWSGFTEQLTKIDWTVLGSRGDAARFASEISAMTRRYHGGATDIEGALQFTRAHVLSAPFATPRWVIDVSGDGKSNVNASPAEERDNSVDVGITINGLAIADNVPTLAEYYRQNVTGGPGSFVEIAKSYKDFEEAMRRKLIREISAPGLS